MDNLTQGKIQQLSALGYFSVEKVSTLDGGTANDPGDFDGTGNPLTLFTVTGRVFVKFFAVCEVNLAGALGTIEVGTALSTTGLIALTTGTDIDANELWHDATPDASVELSSVLTEKVISQDIIQTVRTANLTAGRLRYFCLWKPISSDGNVEAA